MTNRRMFATMLLGSVFRRRSRVLVAVLSSAVGAATLFCLAAICLAVPAQMSAQMRQFGANLIVVPVSADGSATRVSQAAVDAATDAVASATGTAANEVTTASYRYETVRVNKSPYMVAGIDTDKVSALNGHWEVRGSWPAQGEVLVGLDVANAAGLTVGSTVTAEYLSSDNLKLVSDGDAAAAAGAATPSAAAAPTAGPTATASASSTAAPGGPGAGAAGSDGSSAANQAEWRVAGVVDTGGDEDDIIYATEADVDALTGVPDPGYDVVEYSVNTSQVPMSSVVQAVDASHDGIQAEPVSKITSGDTRIITMLNTLFWVVSLVVLALTLVGVSTTMTVIVSERRNEIGLRKALGASGRAISLEFYSQAAALGLIGGAIGTAVGYGLAVAVSVGVFGQAVGFTWWLAVVAVLMTAVVAVIASYSPVRSASRIDPALVLREE
ncbi:MAG: ABC transporter permease [Actinomyces sp.]|nr:MAG: ABC transporter permease [Actinomyces sp.]